jgi:hypothetical protein
MPGRHGGRKSRVQKKNSSGKRGKYLVIVSSSLSIVFCLRSSSMRLSVTSFSLSFDSLVEIGGVTPRYPGLRGDMCSGF